MRKPPETRQGKEYARYALSRHIPGVSLLEARFVDFAYGQHSHEDFAVGVTLSGVQSFRCRGVGQDSTAGRIMTFNPDEAHDGRAGVADGFLYRMIYFPAELMWSVAADLWKEPSAECFFSRNLHRAPHVAGELLSAYELLADDGAAALAVETALTDALARLVLRLGERRKEAVAVRPDRRIVRDAMEIIRDDPERDITLDELAGMSGRSPYSFLRLFRKTTGFPPHRYQIQCRLRLARRRIAEGMSLADAAFSSGFCDQSHLNRRFRQAYGITPGQYRAGIKSS